MIYPGIPPPFPSIRRRSFAATLFHTQISLPSKNKHSRRSARRVSSDLQRKQQAAGCRSLIIVDRLVWISSHSSSHECLTSLLHLLSSPSLLRLYRLAYISICRCSCSPSLTHIYNFKIFTLLIGFKLIPFFAFRAGSRPHDLESCLFLQMLDVSRKHSVRSNELVVGIRTAGLKYYG